MIEMDNAWNASARPERQGGGGGGGAGDSVLTDDDQSRQQFLLGLLERSTSAPPPSGPPGTDSHTFFGTSRDDERVSRPQKASDGLIGSGGSLFAGGGNSGITSGDFLLGGRNSESTGPSLPSSSSSPSLNQLVLGDKLEYNADDDRGGGAIIDSFLDRPKSAAPEFSYSGAGPSRAPPGLGSLRSASAAPPSAGASSLLFDNPADINRSTNVATAPPRPASTGVIGQQSPNASSAVMASLGLIQQTSGSSSSGQNQRSIMDLIREDSPKAESPSSFPHERQQHQRGHGRPSQSSPVLPSHGEVRYQHDQTRGSGFRQAQEGGDGLYKSMQNLNIRGPNEAPQRSNVPQYAPVTASHLDQQQSVVSRSQPPGMPAFPQGGQQHSGVYSNAPPAPQSHQQMFTTAPQGRHAAPSLQHQPPHPQSTYEAQTIYYSTQQQGRGGVPVGSPQVQTQVQSQMQAPMIHTAPPAGGHQAVYVNTPYGYATVQYHTGPPPISHDPHGQPRHVMHSHQIGPGGHPIPQEYIIPLQTGIPAGGTYAYWQQGGEMAAVAAAQGVAAPATMTVLNAHGQPTTIAVAGVATAGAVPLSTPQAVGGRHHSSRGGKIPGGGKPTDRGTPRGKRGVAGAAGGRRGGPGGIGSSEHPKSPGGASSALLDEFRAAKTRNWVIHDIEGHIVEFCQDQNGSRFIQQRLEMAGTPEKELVMTEVLPAVQLLRNDVFGNYVVQKLFEHGTTKMRSALKQTLEGEMLSLSVQMYGCRVVQKALETLDDDHLPGLLTEFHGNVLSCIHDQNGNHVIQKCIEVMCTKARVATSAGDEEMSKFMTDQIQFIIDDVLESVAPLSCHPYGCRVLQRILEHCPEDQKIRALDEIGKCHRSLLDDQYGNYVIQHVLQFGHPADRDSILDIIIESGLLALSRQKFASNVVEKLLKYGSHGQRNAVVREMLKKVPDESANEGEDGCSAVLLMVRDAYANYVVQTTLDVLADGEERRLLLEELNKNSTQLRNYTFAKHIVTKLGS